MIFKRARPFRSDEEVSRRQAKGGQTSGVHPAARGATALGVASEAQPYRSGT